MLVIGGIVRNGFHRLNGGILPNGVGHRYASEHYGRRRQQRIIRYRWR